MPNSPAKMLLESRFGGTCVAADDLRGITDADTAYRIQREQIDLSQERIGGWKLGGTSAPALKLLALDEPFVGPVSAETIYQNDASIAIHPSHSPMLETEFAITLGKDISPREAPYDARELRSAIASVRASFEIVSCRLAAGLAGAGCHVIADHGVNGGAVLGTEVPAEYWDEPGGIDVAISINGDERARGTSAGLLWSHVFDGVAWLANRQGLGARPLCAGDIILTGTCTGVTPIAPGDSATADFAGIARVTARFIAA